MRNPEMPHPQPGSLGPLEPPRHSWILEECGRQTGKATAYQPSRRNSKAVESMETPSSNMEQHQGWHPPPPREQAQAQASSDLYQLLACRVQFR